MTTTLEFSTSSQKSGSVSFTGLQKCIKLRLDKATVVYEPGFFQGTGDEIRVSIVFSVSDQIQQEVQAMENAHGDCSSCMKEGTIKAKVSLDRVRFFDAARNRIEKPGMIRGFACNAMVTVRAPPPAISRAFASRRQTSSFWERRIATYAPFDLWGHKITCPI